MQSTFLAWISRMPLVKRWSLMHTVREENVSEHSHIVAVISHMLCVIENEYFGNNLNPEKAATIALFHDLSETKLQDLNSNTKYHSPEFTEQFKKLESWAEKQCVEGLPVEMRKHYENIIITENIDTEYKKIVKAADIISTYIKAKEEIKYYNSEFIRVLKNTNEKLEELKKELPSIEYYMTHFMDNCDCSLDELAYIDNKNS